MRKRSTTPAVLQATASAEATRAAVKCLRDRLGVSRKTFARLTATSERSIAAWEGGARLSAQSRQRMAEIQRLQQALVEIMDRRLLSDWLDSPNQAFDGLKPLEVIERGQIDRIWRMIFELRSGTPG